MRSCREDVLLARYFYMGIVNDVFDQSLASCHDLILVKGELGYYSWDLTPSRHHSYSNFSSLKNISAKSGRTSPVIFSKTIFKYQTSRLSSHKSKGIGRSCQTPGYFQIQVHPTFVTARADGNVDAREFPHHLFNRSDFFFGWLG